MVGRARGTRGRTALTRRADDDGGGDSGVCGVSGVGHLGVHVLGIRPKGLGWLVRRDVHSEDTICITNLWYIDVHVPRPEIFGENMEYFDLGGISMPVGKLCLECPRSSNRIISRTVWNGRILPRLCSTPSLSYCNMSFE